MREQRVKIGNSGLTPKGEFESVNVLDVSNIWRTTSVYPHWAEGLNC